MSKGLNLKGDFNDQNFQFDFLKMEIVHYTFHTTMLKPQGLEVMNGRFSVARVAEGLLNLKKFH